MFLSVCGALNITYTPHSLAHIFISFSSYSAQCTDVEYALISPPPIFISILLHKALSPVSSELALLNNVVW